MATEIVTVADPVEFTIPKSDGTKVAFSIPPIDYIPRKTMETYREWVRENNRKASVDEGNLKFLELVLDKTTYKLVASYPPAVATQIVEAVSEASKASMGESGASSTS